MLYSNGVRLLYQTVENGMWSANRENNQALRAVKMHPRQTTKPLDVWAAFLFASRGKWEHDD